MTGDDTVIDTGNGTTTLRGVIHDELEFAL